MNLRQIVALIFIFVLQIRRRGRATIHGFPVPKGPILRPQGEPEFE